MGEIGNQNINGFGVATGSGAGNSSFGIEQFLEGTSNMDFNIGLNLDEELIRVL